MGRALPTAARIFSLAPSFAHMHTQAQGSVLQELRDYSTPLRRAKSEYIWTNNPV